MKIENQHIDHDLLMAYLTGETDSFHKDEVESWLMDSEEHASYLKSLELIWIETGKLKPPPVHVDTDKAWQNIAAKLNFKSSGDTKTPHKSILNSKIAWRAAAILLILIGVFGIYKWIGTEGQIKTWASGNQIISDTLTDGTVVALNKNSRLYYPGKFDKHRRNVKLEGEAFFDVKPDVTKPFTVELAGATVKVLGTSFNIKENLEDHFIDVYVKTGTVELSCLNNGNSTSVILIAGEKGRVDTEKSRVEKTIDLGMNAVDVSWLNQTFVFDGVRLEHVAEFLEGYYYVKIEFANENMKDLLLTATFKNDKIDDIMAVIAESFGLELKKTNGGYFLYESTD